MRSEAARTGASASGRPCTAAADGPWTLVYDDPEQGRYVFVCERCGQPLGGPHELCDSALHVGVDGLGVGHAMRSSELARLAGAARAALGGPRSHEREARWR
jgi:hypothetical protein